LSGDHPHNHTTIIRSNDRYVTASISLGDLVYVHAYSSWHSQQALFEVRFQHGSADMSRDALIALLRAGQEALAAAPTDVDCSAITADLGGTA
jgi:hypothetical protein